ncbi:MAG: VTT domain-containing protein [bacterium]|nr:VTT domain-containing protein [bacterium]
MDLFGGSLEDTLVKIGLLGAYLILFAESGLLIGFFLPGDSLLFTAGLLASRGYFSIWALVIGGAIAAIIGNQVGYHFGRRFGPRIFNKEESFLFHKDHIIRAEKFYEKYGGVALIISRFTPIIRTFVPILAGVGKMNYRRFLVYNIVGGILWVFSVSFAGYFLGKVVPDIDRYILPIVAVIIILSAVTPAWGFFQHRKHRRASAAAKSDPNR